MVVAGRNEPSSIEVTHEARPGDARTLGVDHLQLCSEPLDDQLS
jgi:hypothetical protein